MNRFMAAAAAGTIAVATSAGAANAANTATSTVVATSFASYAASASASGPCTDGDGFSDGVTDFWRCTGSAANSRWVGSTCNEGEYNAGSYYNVYGAINECGDRVWLHEYTYPDDTNPSNPGWAVCVSPDGGGLVAPDGIFPENIVVSANPANC